MSNPLITRREFAQCIAAGAIVSTPSARGPFISIERGVPQMFVDDYLIEDPAKLAKMPYPQSAANDTIKRTLHQPKKDNGGNIPVIALDREFGEYPGTLEANGTILFDPRLKSWVMFALGFAPTMSGQDRTQLFRFTSSNAIDWIKGDDGKPQRIVFDLKDAESGESATNIDLFSCFYDRADEQFPYKGWLHFANWGRDKEGTYLVRSHDGRIWERVKMIMRSGSRTIQQGGRTLNGPGDVTIFYRDPIKNQFLANLRFASPTAVGPDNRLRSRALLFVNRMDEPVDLGKLNRVALVPAGEQANGDLPHDEYYSSTAWRYGPLWLGGLKIWHGGGDYPYSAPGGAFLKLAVSRDGLHWSKVPFDNESGIPEVWIRNGAEGGNAGRNDGGYMTEFSQGPLRIGNELIYYYGSSSYGKNKPRNIRVSGGGIFRARMRPDGFVSVDAGSFTTPMLDIPGLGDIVVNGIGPIDVELLMFDGKSLGKASIRGDSLRHRALFNGKPFRDVDVRGRLSIMFYMLRFTVHKGGRLYSFKVT